MSIPRGPFLVHSETLFQHLCSRVVTPVQRILEVGCGPRSPLIGVLKRLYPQAAIYQIDALESAVLQARQANPDCQVEQMLASDLHAIATDSQDLVVGMSVFDQNPVQSLPPIAAEIRRVLKRHGSVIYIHNEEINLPAQADSFVRNHGCLLLPSPRWTPHADVEYCIGTRSAIEEVIARQPTAYQPLIDYLLGILPQVYVAETQNKPGAVRVPFLSQCDVAGWERIRQAVLQVEAKLGQALQDLPTEELLHRHLIDQLFSTEHGFELDIASMFEQRIIAHWNDFFKQPVATQTFVRPCSRYGYSCRGVPPPRVNCIPLSVPWRSADSTQLTMIGYQYGFHVRKS